MQNLTSVFLVEDDEDDQFFFMNAFNMLRHVSLLDTACNGQEALDKLRRVTTLPAVIFIDYNMPIMNGLDFLVEKSKDTCLKDIPVVMLSASLAVREEALNHGAIAFIDKACDEASLRKDLASALDNLTVARH
jgi:CheY-like chemotaxis protein